MTQKTTQYFCFSLVILCGFVGRCLTNLHDNSFSPDNHSRSPNEVPIFPASLSSQLQMASNNSNIADLLRRALNLLSSPSNYVVRNNRTGRAEEAVYGDGYNMGYKPAAGEIGTYGWSVPPSYSNPSPSPSGPTIYGSTDNTAPAPAIPPPVPAATYYPGPATAPTYPVPAPAYSASSYVAAPSYGSSSYAAPAPSYEAHAYSAPSYPAPAPSYGEQKSTGYGVTSYGSSSYYEKPAYKPQYSSGWGQADYAYDQDQTLVYALAFKLKQLRERYHDDIAARDALLWSLQNGNNDIPIGLMLAGLPFLMSMVSSTTTG